MVTASASQVQRESVLDYSLHVQKSFQGRNGRRPNRALGQVFTPPEISRFMAGLISTASKDLRVLDPGAGIGGLSAAICENILKRNARRSIELHLFENDPSVIP